MTQREWLLGSLTFVAVIIAGFFSAVSVDRHYIEAAQNSEAAQTTTGTACVGKDGSWKNWVWANVPALSPKCE